MNIWELEGFLINFIHITSKIRLSLAVFIA